MTTPARPEAAPCGAPTPTASRARESGAGAGGPFECPLCGLRFATGLSVCGGCPLHAGCELVRCPRCAYVFPHSSRLFEALRRAWRRLARSPRAARSRSGAARDADDGLRALDRLAPGTSGRIVYIAAQASERLVRLSSLGVLPGTLVELQQSRPETVVRVGPAILALDRAIAAAILVRPE